MCIIPAVWSRRLQGRDGRSDLPNAQCVGDAHPRVEQGKILARMLDDRRIEIGNLPSQTAKKRFCLILVKPSHYDGDAYLIHWFRSTIPSNSLAACLGWQGIARKRRVSILEARDPFRRVYEYRGRPVHRKRLTM